MKTVKAIVTDVQLTQSLTDKTKWNFEVKCFGSCSEEDAMDLRSLHLQRAKIGVCPEKIQTVNGRLVVNLRSE